MTDIQLEQVLLRDVERCSFEIIREKLPLRGTYLESGNEMVIRGAVHTMTDFDYAQNLVSSGQAVKRGAKILKAGAVIIVDASMGLPGIDKKRLSALGGGAFCFMIDEDVVLQAKEQGTARAVASMEKAVRFCGLKGRPLIFAVGNVLTALARMYELIEEGLAAPVLAIEVPVGFMDVAQSKELILTLKGTPYIVVRGRRGGSSVVVTICNALLYQIPAQGVTENT